jgi:hypothetical protein
MRRHVYPTLVALSLVLALGVSHPAFAKDRPFHLTGIAQLLGDPFADGGAPFIAAGTATHLGHWTGPGHVTFTVVHGVLIAHGTETFQAANGDLLYSTFAVVQYPFTMEFIGIYTFDGGTGRFANARGEVDLVAIPQPGGQFDFTLDGTIDY